MIFKKWKKKQKNKNIKVIKNSDRTIKENKTQQIEK